MKIDRKRLFWDLVKMTVGAFIFALAVNVFALPNDLGEGGVTGVTMILYYTHGISPALTNIFLNTIILTLGYKFLDRKTIIFTFYAIGVMSFFLKITEGWGFIPQEGIVAAIAAGSVMGVGMGLIMKGDGTTAGSAILAKIMNKHFGWNTSYALLFFDLIVVVPSVIVIGLENMILTVISLSVSTKLLDFILEGSNPKKTVMIISDKYEKIAAEVDAKLSRGITMMDGVGYYKREPKKILYVVISREQLIPIQTIINEVDPQAFVTINDAQSVIGEGFTRDIFIEPEMENQIDK
ncbi:YitT family protein [Vagococcus sp.]|uniref:YitT family protein n=1 Tax=Vagococcus sp. TaxID=1933889 RepID=UPI002579C60D|nr:YitT family protein [Vagococcus sp.]